VPSCAQASTSRPSRSTSSPVDIAIRNCILDTDSYLGYGTVADGHHARRAGALEGVRDAPGTGRGEPRGGGGRDLGPARPQRRRLHTAIALVGRPASGLLDEPTVGADVKTRSQLLRVVRDLARDGAAVVYSTHYFPEVAELGASVAILERGRVLARGSIDEV